MMFILSIYIPTIGFAAIRSILTHKNTGFLALFDPEDFRNWQVSVAVGFFTGFIAAFGHYRTNIRHARFIEQFHATPVELRTADQKGQYKIGRAHV